MNNVVWKLKYYEKNNYESHINIFKSLEIENYLKQSLRKKKFNYKIHTYKLNLSNTRVSLFLSIYEKSKSKQIKKNRHKIIQEFGRSSLKSLQKLTKNKLHIIFKIRIINKKFFKKTLKESIRNQTFWYKEDERLYLILATQKDSAELLGTFIARQLKKTKRHNFFLSFLGGKLKKIINQRYCKIKGIKIQFKGRLNNASRSQNRIIQTGTLPITTQNTNINYSETISFTSNGTIGIKIWINQ